MHVSRYAHSPYLQLILKFLNSIQCRQAKYWCLQYHANPEANHVHISLNYFSNLKPLRIQSSFIYSCYKKWQEAEWQNDPQDGTCHQWDFSCILQAKFCLNSRRPLSYPHFPFSSWLSSLIPFVQAQALFTQLLKPFSARSRSKTLIWNPGSELNSKDSSGYRSCIYRWVQHLFSYSMSRLILIDVHLKDVITLGLKGEGVD